jgi:hypothetical protein
LDALRASDQQPVVLKKVRSDDTEYAIHTKILSFQDSERHFIPIYDTILLPDSDEILIMVLPLLHGITKPLFESVFELMECILKLLEVSDNAIKHLTLKHSYSKGLVILHENRIAHG